MVVKVETAPDSSNRQTNQLPRVIRSQSYFCLLLPINLMKFNDTAVFELAN